MGLEKVGCDEKDFHRAWLVLQDVMEQTEERQVPTRICGVPVSFRMAIPISF